MPCRTVSMDHYSSVFDLKNGKILVNKEHDMSEYEEICNLKIIIFNKDFHINMIFILRLSKY